MTCFTMFFQSCICLIFGEHKPAKKGCLNLYMIIFNCEKGELVQQSWMICMGKIALDLTTPIFTKKVNIGMKHECCYTNQYPKLGYDVFINMNIH